MILRGKNSAASIAEWSFTFVAALLPEEVVDERPVDLPGVP